MKHLSLQQAMLGMRVIQTDTGTIIKSPAGSAVYDLKGRRIKVNGYPEYFPDHLRVKDKRKPKHGSALINDEGITCRSADGTVRVRIGLFEKPKAKPDMPGKEFIDRLQGMQEAIADSLDDVKELCIGAYDLPEGKTPVIFLLDRYTAIGGKYTPEEISDAIERIHAGRQEKADKKMVSENFLNEALIQPGSIQAAHIYAGHNFKLAYDERRMEAVAQAPDKAFVTLDAKNTFKHDAATKTRLTDDMREAVLDAVRESDLFKSINTTLNAQVSLTNRHQQGLHDAINDAIKNAVKPGGLLWNDLRGR